MTSIEPPPDLAAQPVVCPVCAAKVWTGNVTRYEHEDAEAPTTFTVIQSHWNETTNLLCDGSLLPASSAPQTWKPEIPVAPDAPVDTAAVLATTQAELAQLREVVDGMMNAMLGDS